LSASCRRRSFFLKERRIITKIMAMSAVVIMQSRKSINQKRCTHCRMTSFVTFPSQAFLRQPSDLSEVFFHGSTSQAPYLSDQSVDSLSLIHAHLSTVPYTHVKTCNSYISNLHWASQSNFPIIDTLIHSSRMIFRLLTEP